MLSILHRSDAAINLHEALYTGFPFTKLDLMWYHQICIIVINVKNNEFYFILLVRFGKEDFPVSVFLIFFKSFFFFRAFRKKRFV